MFSFKVHKELPNGLGRIGTISTSHGDIETPAFVVVGTKGSVKSLTPDQISEVGVHVIIANTYHLYLDPGDEQIAKMGGLHKAMNWSGPLMTDSGGFQVFSLGVAYGKGISKVSKKLNEPVLPQFSQSGPLWDGSLSPRSDLGEEEGRPKIVKIDPNGVMFRDHISGDAHYFTPEKSIEIQHNLGADIIFAFDECTAPNESDHYQAEALERTHRWAKRSLEYHKSKENSKHQAIFGIVQGGRSEKLRKESAKTLSEMQVEDPALRRLGEAGFDGFGIGGSFEKEDMSKAVLWCNELLPKHKPRHLLGIGEPEDLFMAVENGCDLFDCVAPTRNARNGGVYTRRGKLNLMNEKYRSDLSSLDENCQCYTCQNFSRSYVAHLHRAKEILAHTLTSIHNLYFITNMVKEMRKSILEDNFMTYKKDFLAKYYFNSKNS
ncbi:MAG: tRNA guanosine(34) transglycosylase Tgt [Minisyncoccia bacterium]